MYAVVRELRYDPEKLRRGGDAMREFQRLHAQRPGYRGSLTVELEPGHRIAVNLWETEAHATAAREVIEPVVRRLLGPLMAAPAVLIGAGPLVENDVVK